MGIVEHLKVRGFGEVYRWNPARKEWQFWAGDVVGWIASIAFWPSDNPESAGYDITTWEETWCEKESLS